MSSYVKVEKLLLISMSMILILLTPYGNGYVVESVQSEETFKESINNLANWKRYGFKIFVKGLGYVDIPQPAYYEAGANYTTASSGTFRFNSGDYGSAIRKVENLKTTQYKADMWAVTLNLFAKISLIAIAPNQEMKSMRATTSQRMWVDPNDSIFNKSTGEYLLLFSDTAKQSWNAWVTYWHFENRFQCPDPSKPCPSPVGENELEQKVIVSSLLDNQGIRIIVWNTIMVR